MTNDQNEERYEEMSEADFADLLHEALLEHASNNEREEPDVCTFEDAGLLTRKKGLVVRIGETEFQITIVRSA